METNAMKTTEIVALMTKMHNENKIDAGEFICNEEKLDAVLAELNQTFEEIRQLISGDFSGITSVMELTVECKFMCLNFYCLHLLNEEMKKNSLISVSNGKLLRTYLENMMDIGISQNIVPNLPFYKPKKVEIGVKEKYYMLKASVLGIYHYTFCSSLGYYLRNITLSKLFVGLFQLGYCPLMKPSQRKKGSFQMTIDFYEELINDQKYFQKVIFIITTKISTHTILLNLSLLMKPAIPRWFIEALIPHLNNCLKQSNGIQVLFSLMNHVQTSKSSLKPISIVGRLVSMSSKCDNFDSHILPQIDELLYNDSDKELIFLFGEILKYTYNKSSDKGLLVLDKLFCPLKKLVRNSDCSNVDTQRLSQGLINGIRVICYVFVNSIDKMEIQLIKNYICILFNIFIFLEQHDPLSLVGDLRNIIIEYFRVLDKFESFKLLEHLVFNIQSSVYHIPLYNLNLSTDSNNILISFDEKNEKYDVLISARAIYSLFRSDSKLQNLYFTFLLSCLLEPTKFFPDVSLLVAEDEGYLSTFERKLAVFEMLNTLASKDTIKKSFNKKIPEELLHYFNEIFKKALESGAHNDPEHDEYQTVFTTTLILQDVFELKGCNFDQLELINTLRRLRNETRDVELKTLLCKILEGNEVEETISSDCDEVEENIQHALSESIEIQGHGLIVLKKMIMAKHPKAVERKQFIFTIFKERLTHRDTYIYLAAINGIASLADLGTECTNMVLNTLCEEYREFPTEEFGPNATEMRLKVGEVLVKISTKLGDMAPNYKALLLNTFLCGTKDEDHLVRASSLSNLGEICKVLGYKLGSIVTEILLCVHDIVNSDKHEEPRRAAVFVIRQLLVGLGKEMLTILSDDILVVYRTLKFLYENDKDDVLKLQCQLAIEEVNTNMKDILTPRIELNKEKKVVVL